MCPSWCWLVCSPSWYWGGCWRGVSAFLGIDVVLAAALFKCQRVLVGVSASIKSAEVHLQNPPYNLNWGIFIKKLSYNLCRWTLASHRVVFRTWTDWCLIFTNLNPRTYTEVLGSFHQPISHLSLSHFRIAPSVLTHSGNWLNSLGSWVNEKYTPDSKK